MIKYFEFGLTEEELKKAYKKHVKNLHPDNFGNEEQFKEMQNEFEKYTSFGNGENDKTSNNAASRQAFKDIINNIINYNIEIEICGSWIWLTGDTYAIKEELKTLKFRWSSSKKKWYYTESEKSKTRFTQDMEKIRLKYGSEVIHTKQKVSIA